MAQTRTTSPTALYLSALCLFTTPPPLISLACVDSPQHFRSSKAFSYLTWPAPSYSSSLLGLNPGLLSSSDYPPLPSPASLFYLNVTPLHLTFLFLRSTLRLIDCFSSVTIVFIRVGFLLLFLFVCSLFFCSAWGSSCRWKQSPCFPLGDTTSMLGLLSVNGERLEHLSE